ncbi:MAG: sulfurtransferase complex subunit TusB [Gammaproteobacteria bacterium]|nr:sulfurtransferase complex subunit TusB [Gammaproteobacteria bacterium]
MSRVHIVSNAGALIACLPMVEDGDVVLLIEDGVYATANPALLNVDVVALDVDVDARGVELPAHIATSNYAGFVSLVVAHDASVSWS